jgi:hypothetical protein
MPINCHYLNSKTTTKCLFNIAIAILLFGACASHIRRDVPIEKRFLTEDRLWEINQDVRYTYFHYADSSIVSGLMLHWEPDSILIQMRGETKPRLITTDGLVRIDAVTGNKIGRGVTLGTAAAGLYFILVRGWEFNNVSFLNALGKLLVPPAIIITAIGIGSSKETKETYYLPPGFIFDYEAVKRYHQVLK